MPLFISLRVNVSIFSTKCSMDCHEMLFVLECFFPSGKNNPKLLASFRDFYVKRIISCQNYFFAFLGNRENVKDCIATDAILNFCIFELLENPF